MKNKTEIVTWRGEHIKILDYISKYLISFLEFQVAVDGQISLSFRPLLQIDHGWLSPEDQQRYLKGKFQNISTTYSHSQHKETGDKM